MIAVDLDCLDHPGEPLSFVALNSEPRRLVCYLCKLQAQDDELDVIPLKMFLNYILSQTIRAEDVVREVALIDREMILLRQRASKASAKMASQELLGDSLARFCR